MGAEKALEREEKLVEKILSLQNKYKVTEARFEYGEMNITKLNQRIDDIEDEIYREKLKIRSVLMSSMTPSTTCLPTTKQPSHCSSQHSHPDLWKIIASSCLHDYRNHVTLSYSIIYKILYHKVHLKINSEPEKKKKKKKKKS